MDIDQLDDFTRHYLIAALWSSVNSDEEETFDAYGLEDLDPSAIEKARNDCAAFQIEAAGLLNQAYELYQPHPDAPTPQASAGHDFWLTRCGHGVGFWDRGFGPLGDHLSALVGYGTNWPPLSLYLENDVIHMEGA